MAGTCKIICGITHRLPHPLGEIVPLRNYTTLKLMCQLTPTSQRIIPLRNYTTLKRMSFVPWRYSRNNTSTKLHNSQTLKFALRTGQHTGRDAQSVSSAVILYLAQVFVNNQSPFFRQTGMFPGIHQKERVLVVDGCLEETLNGVIREIAAQIYKDE